MAFDRRPQQGRQAPPQGSAYRGEQRQSNLFRLTGMWENAKGIGGSIKLNYETQDGSKVGDNLLALIRDCMERDIPLKLLVFQNDGTRNQGNIPYMAYAAPAEPRAQEAQPQQAPRQAPRQAPHAGFVGGQGGQGQGQYDRPPVEQQYIPPPPFAAPAEDLPDADPDIDATPEPAPRPRRPMPRR